MKKSPKTVPHARKLRGAETESCGRNDSGLASCLPSLYYRVMFLAGSIRLTIALLVGYAVGITTWLRQNWGGILIWHGCAAIVPGGMYGLSLLAGEESLRPPGWDCDARGGQWKTAGCVPVQGYHFEVRGKGYAAVHDYAPYWRRQRDLDIADAWEELTNGDRQQVLDGKATIYDFVEHKK